MRPWDYRPRGHPERGDTQRLAGLEEGTPIWLATLQQLAREEWEDLDPAEQEALALAHAWALAEEEKLE